jgi:hypothetical protein
MVKSIVEEHEWHWLVFVAIVFKHFFHLDGDLFPAANVLIKTWVFFFIIKRV